MNYITVGTLKPLNKLDRDLDLMASYNGFCAISLFLFASDVFIMQCAYMSFGCI